MMVSAVSENPVAERLGVAVGFDVAETREIAAMAMRPASVLNIGDRVALFSGDS
jgi:hypothetical protein